ncbi:hypothetical protein AN416_36555 (plasmid) [Paraburkholderia caribensis]|nr:hypothetical protein AN416_36555 [Paraburkholderia caribensis]AUT57646.1 DUF2795 domain-containing protein [Paraburkholderia caribensis]
MERNMSTSTARFIEVQKALKGASYPARKDALLKTAKENDADETVMEALAALPDEDYDSPAAVSQAVGTGAR